MQLSGGFKFTPCGFGWEGGLFPSIRLGFIHLWWFRGSVRDTMIEVHASLTEALKELKIQ